MKRRFQKLAALFLVGSMTAALVSGCGGSSGSGDSSSGSGDDSSSSGETAEVTLWHYFEAEAPALEALIEEYNEMQSDIHITPTYVSREELAGRCL